MPLWVVNKSAPRHAFPWPLHGNCSARGWMTNTLAEAAGQAYQDLYDNRNGMLDDLRNFWRSALRSDATFIRVEAYLRSPEIVASRQGRGGDLRVRAGGAGV